jgi:hypothetical protein
MTREGLICECKNYRLGDGILTGTIVTGISRTKRVISIYESITFARLSMPHAVLIHYWPDVKPYVGRNSTRR